MKRLENNRSAAYQEMIAQNILLAEKLLNKQKGTKMSFHFLNLDRCYIFTPQVFARDFLSKPDMPLTTGVDEYCL